MTWTRAGVILAVVTPLVSLVWYLSANQSTAQATHKRSIKSEKRVEKLEDIHIKQDSASEATEKLIRKLCAEGKLKGADCVQ